MKNIFIPAVLAALLLGSCSDWTKPESLDMRVRTLEESDPAAYDSYLKSLRTYKNSDHKIVMVTMPGMSEAPSRQHHHLTAMPDSVDIIRMTNVGGLHPAFKAEMQKVRTKGTRVVCVVDYISIQDAWKAIYGEEWYEEGNEGADAEAFAAHCKTQAELQLSYCDQYGFDGIEISYLGRIVTEIEKAGQEAFMACVAEWREAHPAKTMFFRGYVHALVDKAILEDCEYIVLLAGDNTSDSRLTLEVQFYFVQGVPTDRIVLEVAIPSIAEPIQIGATPQRAAEWLLVGTDQFLKLGLAVSNARDDYFNIDLIYKNIREAVGKLNTVPNNEN